MFTTCICYTPGVYAQKMYWTTAFPATIQRSNLDGTNVEILVDQDLYFPAGIAVDSIKRKIYWTNQGTGADPSTIQRANLDGTNVETLISSIDDISEGISLDVNNQRMYWSLFSFIDDAGQLRYANMDGSNSTIIVDTLSFPTDNAIDILEKKLFWIDSPSTITKIQRSNLDGTNIENLVTLTSGEFPTGLALDLTNHKMYWTDFIKNSIHRANLDGTNVEEVITQTSLSPRGIDLDTINNKMYWTDGNNLSDQYFILRADLDGANPQFLVELSPARGLALALDLCGDGNINLEEECDLGAGNSGSLPDTCRTNCLNPSCGDGVVDSGEICDENGETVSCTYICTVSSCGDGIVNETAGELCDDGNLIDLDHCTNACTIGPNVPTVSRWGMIVMIILILISGSLVLYRRRVLCHY